MNEALLKLGEAIAQKQAAVVATVIEVAGASPAKVGAQITLFPDGSTFGTVGGGKLEATVLQDARVALADGNASLHTYQLAEEGEHSIGTLCGGEIRVFIQPYFPPPQLVIVGGGHIGRPLKIMGDAAGFETTVVDVTPGGAAVPELEPVHLTE